MKTFTIDNETNNITVHRTAGDAETVAGAECFATPAALTDLASHWPAARLVEIWNSLPGATAVTRFRDRKTAVTRIWNAIQSLGEPADVKAATKPGVAQLKARTGRKAATAGKKPTTAPEAKGARPDSKTAKILDMLRRPGGAGLHQIMRVTGWQAHSVRGFISVLSGKGLSIASAKTDSGERRYSAKA